MAKAGAVAAPVAIPLLSPTRYLAYEQALGITYPKEQVDELGVMPLQYAFRFGWAELLGAVGDAHAALSPEERARAAVLGSWFGNTSAINFFGAARLALSRDTITTGSGGRATRIGRSCSQ